MAGGLSLARSAHAAEGGPRKIALVGCGGRGTGATCDHLAAAEILGDNVKIVAVADAFEDRAKSAVADIAKRFPKAADVAPERIFVGFDAYEKAIACGVDMVILATSPGFRPYPLQGRGRSGQERLHGEALLHRRPRLPHAAGGQQDRRREEPQGGRRLPAPPYAQLLECVKRIHDGAIGEIMLLRGYWNGGGIWFRDRKPEMTEMEYQMRNWYHFVWLCGDNICEQHVHNIDVCNWVKGDHPVEANGMGSCIQRYKGRDPKKGMGQIFDNHFVEFTYKDGTKFYSQCRHIPKCWGGDGGEKVHGTKGIAVAQRLDHPARQDRVEVQAPKGQKSPASMVQEHMDLIDGDPQGREVQRGPSRRHQQLHGGAGPHGHLLRPAGQMGRRRRQGPERIPREARLGRQPQGPARPGRQLPDRGPRHL